MEGNILKELILFDATLIRDTNIHISNISTEVYNSHNKTIIIHNTLDEDIAIQFQGDRMKIFTNPLDIGSEIKILKGTNTYQTITDFFPFMRIAAICTQAPTSGSLSIWLERGA